jgi:hypothetical protein
MLKAINLISISETILYPLRGCGRHDCSSFRFHTLMCNGYCAGRSTSDGALGFEAVRPALCERTYICQAEPLKLSRNTSSLSEMAERQTVSQVYTLTTLMRMKENSWMKTNPRTLLKRKRTSLARWSNTMNQNVRHIKRWKTSKERIFPGLWGTS